MSDAIIKVPPPLDPDMDLFVKAFVKSGMPRAEVIAWWNEETPARRKELLADLRKFLKHGSEEPV